MSATEMCHTHKNRSMLSHMNRALSLQATRPSRPAAMAVACVGLLFSVTISGCGAASSEEDHHHSHSHDNPRTTFTESVTAIRQRSARFTSGQAPEDDSLIAWKLERLVEIIEALPELAADSDLKKAEWDRVTAISNELLVILRSTDAASRKEPAAGTNRLESLIAELEQMAPLSEGNDLTQRPMRELDASAAPE